MNDNQTISTLNDLLLLSRDGTAELDASAELVENIKIKELLKAAARRCEAAATELAEKIKSLGGEPAEGESLSGSIQVAWTELKSKVAGMSETEVLDECLLREEAAKAPYEAALAAELPGDVKSLVEKQYAGVQKHCELVRGLRSSFVLGHSRT
jgi:uncharacterized protein (TIGR02284 family)